MNKKMEIYDELSMILTDYENYDADEKDLYLMLVKIQNNWEKIIATDETKK